MYSRIAQYVVCPYYRSDSKEKIFCEGVQDNTSIHLVFPDSKDKKPYMHKYCCSMDNYDNCRIADMLNLKHMKDD